MGREGTNLLDEPLDFVPGVRLSVPDTRVDPLAAIFLEFFTVFLDERGV